MEPVEKKTNDESARESPASAEGSAQESTAGEELPVPQHLTPFEGMKAILDNPKLAEENQSAPPPPPPQPDPANPADPPAASGDAVPASGTEQTPPSPEGEKPQGEPFFDIPTEVPVIMDEDTQDAQRGMRWHALFAMFNLAAWCVLIGIFVVIGAALLYFRYAYDRLYGAEFRSPRAAVITISPGDRFGVIVKHLRDAGMLGSYMGVDDKVLLWYLAKFNGNSEKIKAGAYRLNASMNLSEVYERLIKGSTDFKVTIPEGKTVREIAAIVKKVNENFDEEKFVELTRDPQFIASLGFNVPSLEGYLYPCTFYFGPGNKEEELIKIMTGAFRENLESVLRGMPKKDNYSFHEHVIMASLIEREARVDDERPLIASVIFNRLEKGMPLEVDASVHYALNDWGRSLNYSDLKVDSPYNTYKNKGLPPGPICSPRALSIAATYQPAETDYLFYVHKGDGTHAFSSNFEEHKANVRLYRRNRLFDVTPPPNTPESALAVSADDPDDADGADDAATTAAKPAHPAAATKAVSGKEDKEHDPPRTVKKKTSTSAAKRSGTTRRASR